MTASRLGWIKHYISEGCMAGKLLHFNLHFIRAQLHSGQTVTEIHDIYTNSSKTSKTDLEEEKGVLKC